MLGRTSVRVSAGALLCLLTAAAVAQPRGYGIVAKINDRKPIDIENAKNTAHITAIQSWFNWSDLEPSQGQRNWTTLDAWFATITAAPNPKKAVLVIMPINGKDPSAITTGTTPPHPAGS